MLRLILRVCQLEIILASTDCTGFPTLSIDGFYFFAKRKRERERYFDSLADRKANIFFISITDIQNETRGLHG